MDLQRIAAISAPADYTEPPRATRAPAANVFAPPVRGPKELKQAVAAIIRAMAQVSRDLEFAYDPDTHQSVVRVLDRETRQVIRQFPSEEALAIAREIDRRQGLLLRQKT